MNLESQRERTLVSKAKSIGSGLACLFVTVAVALGQTTGSIEGVVYDPSGAVTPGVAVTLVDAGTGVERRLSTDATGQYLAPGLAPGTYDIEVSHPGLRGGLTRGVEVAAGRAARVDFHLELGEAREAVEVVGATPLISVNTNDWGGTIDRRKLDSLPLNGRDVFELSSQESGATAAGAALRRCAPDTALRHCGIDPR